MGKQQYMSRVWKCRFVTATITAICFTEIITTYMWKTSTQLSASDRSPRHQTAANCRAIGPFGGSSIPFLVFFLNNQPGAIIIPILFCYKTLHVSGIFSAHHQEFSTVHLALARFM
jgi:hypothetical protein